MKDYIINNPHLFAGKDNEGRDIVYVGGEIQAWDLENMRIDYRHAIRNAPTENFFPGEMPDLIPTLRAVLPKTGTWHNEDDNKDYPWLGERVLAEGETFDFLKYKAICKEVAEMGVTLLCDGMFRLIPFEVPMVMLFSRDMGRKSSIDPTTGNKVFSTEVLHAKGTPVCHNGTNIVKVYKSVECFSLLEKEGVDWTTDVCRGGWSWITRRDSKARMYTRLDAFLEMQKKEAKLQAFTVADEDLALIGKSNAAPASTEAPAVNEPPVA